MLVDNMDLVDLVMVVQLQVEDLIVLLVEMEKPTMVDLIMVMQLLMVL
jgi:hypothetical protein